MSSSNETRRTVFQAPSVTYSSQPTDATVRPLLLREVWHRCNPNARQYNLGHKSLQSLEGCPENLAEFAENACRTHGRLRHPGQVLYEKRSKYLFEIHKSILADLTQDYFSNGKCLQME